jgi:hypothetical protein
MPFEMVNTEETTKEEVTVPDFKILLFYIKDTDPLLR